MYAKLFAVKLAQVNSSYPGDFRQLDARSVDAISSQWMISLCTSANESINEMCAHFERTELLLEFAFALNKAFEMASFSLLAFLVKFLVCVQELPSSLTPTAIYENLFGTALLDRWKALLSAEIAAAESDLLAKVPHVNCNPPPLFHKRAAKFDSLLATGVSQDLHAVVQTFFERLRDLKQRVSKYVQIGYESDASILYGHLTDAVFDMIKR